MYYMWSNSVQCVVWSMCCACSAPRDDLAGTSNWFIVRLSAYYLIMSKQMWWNSNIGILTSTVIIQRSDQILPVFCKFHFSKWTEERRQKWREDCYWETLINYFYSFFLEVPIWRLFILHFFTILINLAVSTVSSPQVCQWVWGGSSRQFWGKFRRAAHGETGEKSPQIKNISKLLLFFI